MPASLSAVSKFHLDDRRARAIILSAGLLCLLVFSATLFLPHSDGHIVGSDGRAYYAIARSLAFDGDFDYTNEYEWLEFTRLFPPTAATGLPQNPFAIGMPLLWLPALLVAHLFSLALHAFGLNVATDGFGLIYEAAVCIATIIYATLAFVIIYRTIRRFFDTVPALVACLVIWGGTAAVHYIIAEPSMSHGLTLFSLSLFFYFYYPIPAERSRSQWLLIGLTGGLVTLVRWQDGLILLVPAAELLWRLIKGQQPLVETLLNGFVFGAAVLVIFSPQMVMWNAIYGSPITMPQGEGFINWLSPHPVQTLFSTRHGLFTWHPPLLVAFIGLVPLWKKDKVLVLIILYFFLVQLYLNSAVVEWWANDAFGGRRFTSLLPLLATPLAAFFQHIKPNRTFFQAVVALMAVLILWNMLGMVQFVLDFVSRREALTLKELTIDRFLLPLKLLAR